MTSHPSAKIVVVGSINCDITTYMENFPKPHETIMAERTAVSVGGKGLNQAVAAARAGGDVTLIAHIGNDQFGAQAMAYLTDNAVAVDHITTKDGCVTGTATIFVTKAGENMIAVSPGANFLLTADIVMRAYDIIADADVLIVQLEIPLEAIEMALKIAKKEGVKTILNPAPANSAAINLLPLVDIITPNETETEALTGVYPDSLAATEKAMQVFHDLGADGVIITKGEEGCAMWIDGQRADLETFQVDMIDPTGAGDVFNGVFAVGFAQKYDYLQAARTASAAAAISVTRPMAEGAAPFAHEIEDFLIREGD